MRIWCRAESETDTPLSPMASIPSDLPSPSSVESAGMQPQVAPPLRRSSRISRLPFYLHNYKCDLPSSSNIVSTHFTSPNFVNSVLFYDHLSPKHTSFVLNVGLIVKPKYFSEAVKSPEWQQAMKLELYALEMNHTWTVMPLPSDKHTTGCKWVYTVKYKADGTVQRDIRLDLWLKVIHKNWGYIIWRPSVMLSK